jgi:hypothetical protein
MGLRNRQSPIQEAPQMVKNKKRDITETAVNKGEKEKQLSARKISASTPYETCKEGLSAFGGLLALIKFFDLVGFEQIFEHCFTKPKRIPKLGHYRMVLGVIVLLFIGFTRIESWYLNFGQCVKVVSHTLTKERFQ